MACLAKKRINRFHPEVHFSHRSISHCSCTYHIHTLYLRLYQRENKKEENEKRGNENEEKRLTVYKNIYILFTVLSLILFVFFLHICDNNILSLGTTVPTMLWVMQAEQMFCHTSVVTNSSWHTDKNHYRKLKDIVFFMRQDFKFNL